MATDPLIDRYRAFLSSKNSSDYHELIHTLNEKIDELPTDNPDDEIIYIENDLDEGEDAQLHIQLDANTARVHAPLTLPQSDERLRTPVEADTARVVAPYSYAQLVGVPSAAKSLERQSRLPARIPAPTNRSQPPTRYSVPTRPISPPLQRPPYATTPRPISPSMPRTPYAGIPRPIDRRSVSPQKGFLSKLSSRLFSSSPPKYQPSRPGYVSPPRQSPILPPKPVPSAQSEVVSPRESEEEMTIDRFMEILRNNTGIVIFKLGSKQCDPCKLLDEYLEKKKPYLNPAIKIYKVDVEHDTELREALMETHSYIGTSIPILLAYEKPNTKLFADKYLIGFSNTSAVDDFFKSLSLPAYVAKDPLQSSITSPPPVPATTTQPRSSYNQLVQQIHQSTTTPPSYPTQTRRLQPERSPPATARLTLQQRKKMEAERYEAVKQARIMELRAAAEEKNMSAAQTKERAEAAETARKAAAEAEATKRKEIADAAAAAKKQPENKNPLSAIVLQTGFNPLQSRMQSRVDGKKDLLSPSTEKGVQSRNALSEKIDKGSISVVPPEMQGDYDLMLKAVTKNGLLLKSASKQLKEDESIVEVAIRQNPSSISYASNYVKHDPNFLKKYMTILKPYLSEFQNDVLKWDADNKQYIYEKSKGFTGFQKHYFLTTLITSTKYFNGILKMDDGTVYDGGFDGSYLHGFGTFTYQNGLMVQGMRIKGLIDKTATLMFEGFNDVKVEVEMDKGHKDRVSSIKSIINPNNIIIPLDLFVPVFYGLPQLSKEFYKLVGFNYSKEMIDAFYASLTDITTVRLIVLTHGNIGFKPEKLTEKHPPQVQRISMIPNGICNIFTYRDTTKMIYMCTQENKDTVLTDLKKQMGSTRKHICDTYKEGEDEHIKDHYERCRLLPVDASFDKTFRRGEKMFNKIFNPGGDRTGFWALVLMNEQTGKFVNLLQNRNEEGNTFKLFDILEKLRICKKVIFIDFSCTNNDGNRFTQEELDTYGGTKKHKIKVLQHKTRKRG